MKKLVFSVLAAVAVIFVACAASESKAQPKADGNVLVAVFSAQGHTKALAEKNRQRHRRNAVSDCTSESVYGCRARLDRRKFASQY